MMQWDCLWLEVNIVVLKMHSEDVYVPNALRFCDKSDGNYNSDVNSLKFCIITSYVTLTVSKMFFEEVPLSPISY